MIDLVLENQDLLEITDFLSEEEALNEALFDSFKLPADLKRLRDKLKEDIQKYNKEETVKFKEKTLKQRMSYNLSSTSLKDAKKAYVNFLSKSKIEIYRYVIITTTTNTSTTYTHEVIGKYKDYVIKVTANSYSGSQLYAPNIRQLYSENICSIPKEVVFNTINIIQHINNVSCGKNSVKFTPKSSSYVETALPKLQSKYGDKYDVKKNIGGFSLTISEKK